VLYVAGVRRCAAPRRTATHRTRIERTFTVVTGWHVAGSHAGVQRQARADEDITEI